MNTQRHTNPRPLIFSAPVCPARAKQVLGHQPAYLEFQNLASAIARSKGLDPEEVRQTAALRIIKSDPMINDPRHWVRFSAAVLRSCCCDAWRARYRGCFKETASIDAPDEFGAFPAEVQAGLATYHAQVQAMEQERLFARQSASLAHLIASGTQMDAAAQRVLGILMDSIGKADTFKKNGRLNGNAVARSSGLSQSTISRQIPAIRAAAAQALAEASDLGGVGI